MGRPRKAKPQPEITLRDLNQAAKQTDQNSIDDGTAPPRLVRKRNRRDLPMLTTQWQTAKQAD